MKTLLLLRHAKSSWKDAELDDHDRPLNKRGKQDAPRMGRLLRDEDLLPDVILCSTAKRARKTIERVIEASGFSGPCELDAALYGATPADYLRVLAARADDQHERVMLVGHNPGMEELLEGLIGSYESLPTAALAQVELDVPSWRELGERPRGKLVHVWRPKELG